MEVVGAMEKHGGLVLTLRLVTWDGQDADRRIRDIKEQEVGFARAADDADRTAAYAKAWAATLARAFEHLQTCDVVETLMPHDLVFTDVLSLKTATTQEAFEAAFMQRSRLGKYAGAGQQATPSKRDSAL